MSRHSHDGPGAVAHHNVVCDPDREELVIDGVDGEGTGEDPRLVLVEIATVHVGLGCAGFLINFDGLPLLLAGDLANERMLGRHHHVSGPKQGVRTGGENLDVSGKISDLEPYGGTLAAAYPIFLKQLDALGPVQGVEFIDKTLGVLSDAQHPLAEGAALNGVAFGLPFLDVFGSQHGPEVRRPPDGGIGNIGQADGIHLIAGQTLGHEFGHRLGFAIHFTKIRSVELEKYPLGPAHVLGVGGGEFPVPVVGKAERLELAAERGDIRGGGDGRVLAGFDRVLLGWQAKRIVAHWMEDVEAPHAFVPPDDIGGGVAFRVADVQAGTARIGKHVQNVVFRLGRIKAIIPRTGSAKRLGGIPAGLPGWLKFTERKWFAGVGHGRERRPLWGLPARLKSKTPAAMTNMSGLPSAPTAGSRPEWLANGRI